MSLRQMEFHCFEIIWLILQFLVFISLPISQKYHQLLVEHPNGMYR